MKIKIIYLCAILFFSCRVQSCVIVIKIGTIPRGLIRANKDEKHKIKNSIFILFIIVFYIFSFALIPNILRPLSIIIRNESTKNNREFVIFLSSVMILWFA